MAEKMTAETKQRLTEELEYLRNEGKREAGKNLEEARAFGDLSENYEYKVAREEKEKIDARIVELEAILSKCEVYEHIPNSDTVVLGSIVTIEDEDGKKTKYEIVGTYESDPNATPKRISNVSPLGRAIFGAEIDDEIDFTHNGKTTTYVIVEIE
jgi:transcription elongation factor GreA